MQIYYEILDSDIKKKTELDIAKPHHKSKLRLFSYINTDALHHNRVSGTVLT